MAISITATPSVLVEEEGTLVTLTLNSSEPIPEGGLVLTVSSETVNALGQFDVLAAQPDNVQILGVTDDTNGFRVRLNEQTGTITLPVFDDSDQDSPLDLTFSVEPGSGYTVDESAGSVTLSIEDAEGGMTTPPDEATDETSGTGLPLVSLNTGPDYLVEASGTVSAHVFNVTEETIPEGGIVVEVNAPNLNEFDLDAIEVGNGGEIVNVREDGFDIRLTDFTTLINLPVAADEEASGLETASFSLVAGDGYEVNEAFGSGSFSIADTADEIPAGALNQRNDTLPEAIPIELSEGNPTFFTTSIDFDIGNRYENEDGTYNYIDATEDVDFYSFELKAGDVVSIDADRYQRGEPSEDLTDIFVYDVEGPDLAQQIFDSEGNELAANWLGQGPGELYQAEDSYLEFEAPKDGTYYLGVSQTLGGYPDAFVELRGLEETQYDPFVPGSGDNGTYRDGAPFIEEYDLTVSLNPEVILELPQFAGDGTGNSNSSNSSDTESGSPTVSLDFLTFTTDSETEDLTSPYLIEGTPGTGSSLVLTLETEGEIPEEGVLVNVNSDNYLRQYVARRTFQQGAPFTPGSELESFLFDDTGRETGFQLRVFEPLTFITLNAQSEGWADIIEPDVEAPEDVNFFLESGEGYNVDSDDNEITATYYDEEQVPEPSVVPEVGLSLSETELIESEGTATTLTFTLSEPPPEEGVVVQVNGSNAGIFPQFDIFNLEIDGGVFPSPNFDFSNFFFKITDQVATITLPVFEDPFDEGLQSFSFSLQEAPNYTIASDASEATFTIADNPDSVVEVSLSSQEGVALEEGATSTLVFESDQAFLADSLPEVTVTTDTGNLSEFDVADFNATGGEITEVTDSSFSFIPVSFSDTTVKLPVLLEGEVSVDNEAFSVSEVPANVLTFNLTAEPPEEGVTVSVDAPNLSEFDESTLTVTGGEITEITDSGFSINITDVTATIELPVLADGEIEGLETTTFSLAESTESTINPDTNEATITLADNPDQIPVTEEIDANDTIVKALDLNLNPENNFSATVRGGLSSLEPEQDFTETNDASEDVDFYTFDLKAGDTVTIDVDAVGGLELVEKLEGVDLRVDSELRLFDANGNELASVNNAAAPDEEFSRDPYLEFTAQEAGSYYVGVSQLGNNNYDPNVEGSGSGWIFPEIGVFSGEYELNVSLTPGNVSEQPTTEPVFGSLEADIIEVSGSSQLIFGGDSDDLIDASISSEGNNRIYAGSADDTLILGNGDRLVGGEGADKFFAMSGGDNIITGGEGADQFWIATAETPDSANIITDFTSGEDVLGIAGLGIGFDDLSITQQDDNTLIAANNSELAILQGVGMDMLIADNFAFA